MLQIKIILFKPIPYFFFLDVCKNYTQFDMRIHASLILDADSDLYDRQGCSQQCCVAVAQHQLHVNAHGMLKSKMKFIKRLIYINYVNKNTTYYQYKPFKHSTGRETRASTFKTIRYYKQPNSIDGWGYEISRVLLMPIFPRYDGSVKQRSQRKDIIQRLSHVGVTCYGV